MKEKQDLTLEQMREAVKADAADEACIALARKLVEEKSYAEAREVLFAAIAKDPHLSIARLLLSRAFYLDNLLEFSVRELVELQKYTDVPSLEKLLDAFGPYAAGFRPSTQPSVRKDEAQKKAVSETVEESDEDDDEDILAEIDIDDEFLDALNELEEDD